MVLTFHRDNFMRRVAKIVPASGINSMVPWLSRSLPRIGGMKRMCWFSAEHVNKIEDAKAGQRLGIKKMHWDRNWVVGETELETPRPCPVCLNDQTKVLFRFSESQQASLHSG